MVAARPILSVLRSCSSAAGPRRWVLAARLFALMYTHAVSGESAASHAHPGVMSSSVAPDAQEAAAVAHSHDGPSSHSGERHVDDHNASAPVPEHAAHECVSSQPQQGVALPPRARLGSRWFGLGTRMPPLHLPPPPGHLHRCRIQRSYGSSASRLSDRPPRRWAHGPAMVNSTTIRAERSAFVDCGNSCLTLTPHANSPTTTSTRPSRREKHDRLCLTSYPSRTASAASACSIKSDRRRRTAGMTSYPSSSFQAVPLGEIDRTPPFRNLVVIKVGETDASLGNQTLDQLQCLHPSSARHGPLTVGRRIAFSSGHFALYCVLPGPQETDSRLLNAVRNNDRRDDDQAACKNGTGLSHSTWASPPLQLTVNRSRSRRA